MEQVGWYMAALFRDGSTIASGIGVDAEVGLHLAAGLLLSFAPALPGFGRLVSWFDGIRYRDELSTAFALILFALSAGRIAGATFSPFLYFRF
jgi:hypothetical protein